MKTWTKKHAAEQAMFIAEGACNLTGVCLAMHEIGLTYLDEGTDAANRSAPMQIAMDQAAYLCSGHALLTPREHMAAYQECERLANE